tara:strand:+ start:120481 stop:121107 length:627 start_codon:yes stop_codon:yes gene_type:complete
MSKAFIKICGITRKEDAQAAVTAGADAIGLVFYAKSPRAVSLQQSKAIVDTILGQAQIVALFVDAEVDEINNIINQLPVDVLQFHGQENQAFCQQFGKPYWKAVRVQSQDDIIAAEREYPDAAALLLDAYQADVPGGTGQLFDWSLVPSTLSTPIVLAGGLTPANVTEALEQVKPWGIDVSGGVEASKGIKDNHKITQFIQAVRHATI